MKSIGAFLMTLGTLGFVLPLIGVQFRLISLLGDTPILKIIMIGVGAVLFVVGLVVDATRRAPQPAGFAPQPPPLPGIAPAYGGPVMPPHGGPGVDQFMMNCPRCNSLESRTARFCGRCGLSFNPNVPPPAPRPVSSGGGGWIILLLVIAGGVGAFFLYRSGTLQRWGIGPKKPTVFAPADPSTQSPPTPRRTTELKTTSRLPDPRPIDLKPIDVRPTDVKPIDVKPIERKPAIDRSVQLTRAYQRIPTDPAGALADYRALVAASPADLPTRHLRNRLEMTYGSIPTALADAQSVASQRPNDVQAQLTLAQAHLWTGDGQSANQAFTRIRTLDPYIAGRLFQEGRSLYDSGYYGLANVNFVTVVWLDTNNVEAFFYLARARQGMQAHAAAAQSFQDFLNRAPNHPWAPTARQELERLKQHR